MAGGLMFPGGKRRKPPKPNPTEGLAFPKPTRRGPKAAKRMEQRTFLRRHTRIKAKRDKPRRGPWRSKEYRARVRELECCAPNAPIGCRGRITCSHLDVELTEKGAGMKTGDQNTAPHCWGHNCAWDQKTGPFRGWTKVERARYAEEAIHETQVTLGLRQAA
jgi:hypothetical protein